MGVRGRIYFNGGEIPDTNAETNSHNVLKEVNILRFE